MSDDAQIRDVVAGVIALWRAEVQNEAQTVYTWFCRQPECEEWTHAILDGIALDAVRMVPWKNGYGGNGYGEPYPQPFARDSFQLCVLRSALPNTPRLQSAHGNMVFDQFVKMLKESTP